MWASWHFAVAWEENPNNETEMAKAISLHLIPAEFQREVLKVVFLDTASSCFEIPVIAGFSSFMSL